MTDTIDTETRKPNPLKPRRALGNVVARQRRYAMEKIVEQREARQKRETEAAREELKRLKERKKQVAVLDADPMRWGNSLLRTTISNQTTLLRSWGLKQPVIAAISDIDHVSAWTDFKKVSVTWPKKQIPLKDDVYGTRDMVASVKGVMQHEFGHLRFTTPFTKIMEEGPILNSNHPDWVLHRTWNLLEDQRMEGLVVEAVPRIAQYFGVMVAKVVLNNAHMNQSWIMLAGRTYLPLPVLKKSYDLFDEFCLEQGIKDGAKTWFNLVQDYRGANTNRYIAHAVANAYEFIIKVRATLPEIEHSQMDNDDGDANAQDTARPKSHILDMFDTTPPPPSKKKSKEQGAPGPQSDGPPEPGEGEVGEGEDGEGKGKGDEGQGEDGEGQDSEGEGEGESDAEGEGKGQGKGEADDKSGKTNAPKGQSDTGAHDGTDTGTPTEADLEELLNQLTEDWQEDLRQDADVKEVVRETRSRESNAEATGLPDFPNVPGEMPAQLISAAMRTASGIEDALNTFLTDVAPMWHQRHERGVINPVHYRTKKVGELDYRRNWDDKGNSGLNVHVSMLCDISGSMGGPPMAALSESVYATAIACQRIGIGSSFTLWSTPGGNYRIFRNGNVTPTLWSAQGGTDPLLALDDLDTHNPEGAEHHLVIIFTDGAWNGNFPSLRQWDAPNRNIVLVRYGSYDGAVQKDMGAHRHIAISDVRDLAKELTKSLADILDNKEG